MIFDLLNRGKSVNDEVFEAHYSVRIATKYLERLQTLVEEKGKLDQYKLAKEKIGKKIYEIDEEIKHDNEYLDQASDYEKQLFDEKIKESMDYRVDKIKLESRINSLENGDAFSRPLGVYLNQKEKIDEYIEKKDRIKNSRRVKKTPSLKVKLQKIDMDIARMDNMETELFKNMNLRLLLPPEYAKKFETGYMAK